MRFDCCCDKIHCHAGTYAEKHPTYAEKHTKKQDETSSP